MTHKLIASALLGLCTLALATGLPAQSYPRGAIGQDALREMDRAAAAQIRRGGMNQDDWDRYARDRQADRERWARERSTYGLPRSPSTTGPAGAYGSGPGRGYGPGSVAGPGRGMQAGPGYGRGRGGPGRGQAGPYGPSYGPGPKAGPYGPGYGPGPYR